MRDRWMSCGEGGEGIDYFRGAHTGYRRLTPPVTVTREIALVKDGPDVVVRDAIEGRGYPRAGVALSSRSRGAAEWSAAASGCRHGREAWFSSILPPPETRDDLETGWSFAELRRAQRNPRHRAACQRRAMPQVSHFRFGLVAASC